MYRGIFFYIKLLIMVLYFFLFISGFVFSITLYMKEIVCLNGSVTLGDLLFVKDSSYHLKKQIEEYKLFLLPERIHIIPSRYVRELVSRFTDQSVIITGKRTVLLPDKILKNLDNEYVHRLVEFLLSILCNKDNRMEIEILSFPYSTPGDREDKYSFRLKTKQEYMGFLIGEVKVHVDKGGFDDYEEEDIRLNVHQYIPVVKAKTDLERNEALHREKLIISEEKLNPFPGEVLLPHEQIEDFHTIKKIETGEIIYKSFVRKSMKVRAGEKVTIKFKKGKILLSMTGRAGDSGVIGDSVKVRPSQSTEWIIGEVTGPKEVLVEM